MKGRARIDSLLPILAGLAGLLVLATTVPALGLELRESPHGRVAITIPDGWALTEDGTWALAEAPDRKFHVRVGAHEKGLLSEGEAEAYLLNFIVQRWGTYTVDRHIRRVICGRFAGVELYGHGAGDGWDRAKFHLYLLVEQSNPLKGAVVLVTGREDAWETYHPALDHAVHAIHGA